MTFDTTPFRKVSPLFLPLLLILIAFAAPSLADEAADIIAKTGAFYANQKALSADVAVNLVMPKAYADMGGIPPMSFQYNLQSPNRLALIPPKGDMASPVVQDGKQYYSEMKMMGASILRDAMPLADFCTEDGSSYLQLPGAEFLVGLGLDPASPGALRAMTGVKLIGEETIDETDCHHFDINGPQFTGELWVAKGKKPWVVRLVQPAPEAKPDESGMIMIQPGLDMKVTNWNNDPEFGDAFAIKPNKDLKQRDTIPSMEEMMAGMGQGGDHGGPGGPGGGPEGPHPSIDNPAPKTELKLMDGKTINLSDLKGKVVVLDFWATWCKPCVMGLPLVTKVTDDLADQGVAFFAVNQRQTVDTVKSFLKEKGMDFTVALDKDANIGQAYGVNGIPHSVIIDKKGIVRKVHVGFGPGMDAMLKNEILELLAE